MKRVLHNSVVLRHRDLRIAAPARAVGVLGDDLALVALMLRVHDLGAGSAGIALLLGCAAVPTMLLAPWAGRLVDRTDSRRLGVTAALAQAAVCVAMAFAGPLWLVLVLVALLQVGQVVANPTWQALVPRITGPADVGRAIGSMQALQTLGSVAGPPLGGLLYGVGGTRAALLVDAATFGVLAVAAVAVRTRRGGPRDVALTVPAAPPRALDGLRSVGSDRLLVAVIGALVAYVVVGEATNAVEVLLVRDHLHGTATQYGLVGTAVAVGIVAGSLLAGRFDGGRRVTALVVAAAALSVCQLTAGLVPTVTALLAVFVLLGVANGVINAAASALVMTRTPDARRGQVGAALNGTTRGASLVALALGGLAGATLGPAPTFVVSGVLALVVAGALGVRALPLRRTPPPEQVTADVAPAVEPVLQVGVAVPPGAEAAQVR